MRAELERLERDGSRPLKTWAAMLDEGRRFERWLVQHGLTIAAVREVADVAPFGKPRLPPTLVDAYLYDIASLEMKPKTLQNLAGDLLGCFRGTGWAVPKRHEVHGGAHDLSTIGAIGIANPHEILHRNPMPGRMMTAEMTRTATMTKTSAGLSRGLGMHPPFQGCRHL